MKPLILTLQIDPESFGRLDALRRQYFPPARNFLSAHITLFHKLPGEERAQLEADISEVGKGMKAFAMPVLEVWHLGFGVAYRLEAGPGAHLRAALADRWRHWLLPQDIKRDFKPHVTVQNKVSGAESKALLERLRADFLPLPVTATGVELHRYCNGPWEKLGEWRFGLEQPERR